MWPFNTKPHFTIDVTPGVSHINLRITKISDGGDISGMVAILEPEQIDSLIERLKFARTTQQQLFSDNWIFDTLARRSASDEAWKRWAKDKPGTTKGETEAALREFYGIPTDFVVTATTPREAMKQVFAAIVDRSGDAAVTGTGSEPATGPITKAKGRASRVSQMRGK